MTPQEVTRLLTVIHDVMDRAIFLVLLRTGIRVGELLRLTIADVDLAQSAPCLADRTGCTSRWGARIAEAG